MQRADEIVRVWPIAIVVGGALGVPGAGRAESLRCGVHLVQPGDSAAAVEAWCGPPTRKVPIPGKRRVLGEAWTYDRGSTEFVRYLVFIAGTLQSIEQGGYGGGR